VDLGIDLQAGVLSGVSPTNRDQRLLDGQDKTQTVVDLDKLSAGNSTNSLGQERFVHRNNLGDVYNGRFRKAGTPGRKTNVSRSISESNIRRDDSRNHCIDAAIVETVRRDDQQRPPEPGA
jgi:hypothetical protein